MKTQVWEDISPKVIIMLSTFGSVCSGKPFIATFPLSITIRFGTVWYTIICHYQNCTKSPYYNIPILVNLSLWYNADPTHCSLLNASRQKADYKCCCRTVTVTLVSFIDFFAENVPMQITNT